MLSDVVKSREVAGRLARLGNLLSPGKLPHAEGLSASSRGFGLSADSPDPWRHPEARSNTCTAWRTSASPRCPRLARLVGGVLAAGSCQTGPAAQAALRRRHARHDALASGSPSAVAFHGLCAARGGRRASLEDLGDAVQGSDLADAWQARHFVQGAGRGTPAPFSHELQAQRLQAHAPLDAFGLCQGNGKFCEASGRRQVRAHLTWHQIQAV